MAGQAGGEEKNAGANRKMSGMYNLNFIGGPDICQLREKARGVADNVERTIWQARGATIWL